MDRILFTAEKVASILGGGWIGKVSEQISNIQIDSRKCGRGTLFIPLKGERTDGHLYMIQISGLGTKFSLVDIQWFSENRDWVEELIDRSGMAFLPVTDPLSAMQKLAAYHISRFPELLVVGITGSNGKTTTKEILGGILSKWTDAVTNEGNFNSDIGLPLSVFRVEKKHKVAVFEMGMNRVGEMDLLASIVKPDIAVITNIGTAHIGPLGDRDGIAEAKSKIFSCFTGSETAIIPQDDDYSEFLQGEVHGETILYGLDTPGSIKVVSDFSIEGFDLEIDGYSCRLALAGKHNLLNVIAAVVTAMKIGVSSEVIADAINNIKPVFGRGELIKGEITLLRDCYNANPDSTTESLKLLDLWKGRSVAVLGDMLELGEESFTAHRRIGEIAAKSTATALFLFGKEMEAAFDSIKGSKFSGYSFWTDNFRYLKEALEEYLEKGDLVLLKGSRSLALERLTDLIIKK